MLAGCAPCQPFSTYSQSRKTPDGRWELLRSFLRLADDLRPEIVTMENVHGLSAKPIWWEFVEGLKDAGYYVTWEEVLCSDFGVPQSRKRLVLIASQIGPVEMPTAQIGRRGGLCEMLSLTYPRWGQARHMPMMRCTSLAVSVRPISNVSGPRNQAAVGGIGLTILGQPATKRDLGRPIRQSTGGCLGTNSHRR